MSNEKSNSSFKGVGRYMFTSNKIYTQRLSVTGNTNLASVTVTDGLTITDGGLSVTGNTNLTSVNVTDGVTINEYNCG